MGILKFNDGWTVDVGGPYRVIHGPDGWYVVGEGLLLPVDSKEEGEEEIKKLQNAK